MNSGKVKSTDVRIGNWIMNDYTCKPQQVYPMMIAQMASIEESGGFLMMSGIPLNIDILAKCGFNDNPDWGIKKYDGTTCVLDLGYLFLASNMMGHGLTLYDSNGFSTGIYIDTIHHLQNFYFDVKNEELRITL